MGPVLSLPIPRMFVMKSRCDSGLFPRLRLVASSSNEVSSGDDACRPETAPSGDSGGWQMDMTDLHEAERCYHMIVRWTASIMRAIMRIEETEAYLDLGYESIESWMSAHFGMGFTRAEELVKVALALKELPVMAEAYEQGRLSYDHLRALVQIATPGEDRHLTQMAEGMSVKDTFRMMEMKKKLDASDAEQARDARGLKMSWDRQSRVLLVNAVMPEDMGAKFEKAIDDLARMVPDDPGSQHGPTPLHMKRADALAELAEGYLRSGGSPSAQVVVHIDAEALVTGIGVGEIEGATFVSPETVRKMFCDSLVTTVLHGHDGKPIGFGRTRRTASARLKQELRRRDVTCRFPGCRRTKLVDAHHIEHWGLMGNTDYDNLILFCWHHHHLVHEPGYEIVGEPPNIMILAPNMPAIRNGPPPVTRDTQDLFDFEFAFARGPDDP